MSDNIQSLNARIEETKKKLSGETYTSFYTKQVLLNQVTQMSAQVEILQRLNEEKQLCPKCHGQGIISKPPYVPGDIDQWTSSSMSFQCDVCNGNKVI